MSDHSAYHPVRPISREVGSWAGRTLRTAKDRELLTVAATIMALIKHHGYGS